MGGRIGQQPFSRLNLMRLRLRSAACCLGPRPFSAARRPSGAYLCDLAVLPHAALGWTAPRCSETPAKSQASPRSDGRLFLLELARVAASGR